MNGSGKYLKLYKDAEFHDIRRRIIQSVLRICFLLPILSIFVFVDLSTAERYKTITEKRGGPMTPTDIEIRYLPKFCYAKLKDNVDSKARKLSNRYKKAWGAGYGHLHHFCNSINLMNRIAKGQGDRRYQLSLALSNVDYVIFHCGKDFILLPQFLKHKGKVLSEMGRTEEAFKYFTMANQIQVKRQRNSKAAKQKK